MQEEKKNQNTGAEKNEKHSSRRHGYFMTPSTHEQAANNSQPDRAQQNSGTQDNRQGQKKDDQHHDRKPNKQNKKNNNNTQKRPSEQAESNQQKPTEQNTQKNAPKQAPANEQKQAEAGVPTPKKKNNRHKKKNKNNSATQASTVENTEKQQKQAPKASEKSKSRSSLKDQKPITAHSADDYEEYKFTPDIPKEVPVQKPQPIEDPNAPKTEVVGVRFKSSGKVYYFDPNHRTFKKGTHAIVDTARGQEFGEISLPNTFVKTADIVPPLRPVIRSATTADVEHHKANKQKEEEAFKICNEKIAEHKLEMKLIDAQYTFDNSKLLFYFTSSERVDFRELVKDLASVFRTRIELRQIGIRDEAKIMGGLGMCGRPLCCTLFLSDFDQVSIKMAKEQNLSLNSAKISGICGRLMCCLKYEHEAYEYEIKRTPPVDSLVRTENGDGIVTEISPLQGTVRVKLLASPDVPPKSYHRDNVTMLRKKQDKQ